MLLEGLELPVAGLHSLEKRRLEALLIGVNLSVLQRPIYSDDLRVNIEKTIKHLLCVIHGHDSQGYNEEACKCYVRGRH